MKKNPKFKGRKIQVFIVIVLLISEFIIVKLKMNNEMNKINQIYKVRVESLENLIDPDKISENPYFNFSIDDTIDVFEDLNSKSYESIFDNSFLAYLKNLHDLYGVKVVLYCFYENIDTNFNLSKMTDRYKDEFQKNSSWLKMGFHSINGQVDYSEASDDMIVNDYNKVIQEILRFAGKDCLEQVIRLQGFYGTKEATSALNVKSNGVKGYLTADDDRISYELSNEEISLINTNKLINSNGMYFLRTDLRIEDIENLENVLDIISSREDPNYIVFTHERKLKKKVYRHYLEDILLEALESNYYFDFVRLD